MQPWCPYHFCPQAPLGDRQVPNEGWLVFSRLNSRGGQCCGGTTYIFADLRGFGVGAPAAFPCQWTSGGKIMKPKACITIATFFPFNSWHVLASCGKHPGLKTQGGLLKTLTWSLPGTMVSRCFLHPWPLLCLLVRLEAGRIPGVMILAWLW